MISVLRWSSPTRPVSHCAFPRGTRGSSSCRTTVPSTWAERTPRGIDVAIATLCHVAWTSRMNPAVRPGDNSTAGVSGFDFVHRTRGSGPRMSRDLVNHRGELLSADEKRTDFALAARGRAVTHVRVAPGLAGPPRWFTTPRD